MRTISLFAVLVLSACSAASATDIPATEIVAMPPIEIASMPEVQVTVVAQKRIIEVGIGAALVDGVAEGTGVCVESLGDGMVDYNGCCPANWHVLAQGANGLLCEED